MGYLPAMIGNTILDESCRVGPSGGMLPYRAVIFDNTYTPGPGDAGFANVKYPNTTFANGERCVGVIVDPVVGVGNPISSIQVIAQATIVRVRTHGNVPVLTDNTTGGTNLKAGDYAAASVVATYDGCVHKAALTNNALSTGQHVLGVSWTTVAANGLYALITIQPHES